MSPFLIAPSILSANFACLGNEVDKVIAAGADLVHFDVMDNHYVPNLTVGPLVCQSLVKHGVSKPIDVHLMVEPVDQMIEDFAAAGANRISFHPEATRHLDRSLQLIIDSGCEAGVVLNPATPLHCLDYIINKLDFILMMSVNPGFGGQQFIPQTLEKIRKVKQRVRDSGKPIRIQIDGGVKVDNIRSIAEAGADTFVAGSAIFNQPDYKLVIDQMRAELNKVNMA
ncbi:ribulose-phosphate 3-epimerase [Aliiglaciecola lipolytica]|uniref:Ribulose-phosphate 3-epimerase n=1 Tax=Aliiglaciecola lipolytica E3 TaxID=1127673 RepID=K6YCX8_9ALTE|nr:ribulose-phosphate 3-epimerase [Aliiglaciecola lipolytica]GAC16052.1 ribulose-phosphate 3-epimerase [Aliiglaciecola lipolytica E3]